MTITLLISYSLLCLLLIVVQCEYQANRFRQNKPISHFWQAFLYSFICSAICLAIIWGRLDEWHYYKECGLICFTTRLAIFSPLLNIIRGRNFFYNGLNSTGSLTDKIENKLTQPVVVILKCFYIVVWATITILIYKSII